MKMQQPALESFLASPLERILLTERLRRRLGPTGDFQQPVVHERAVLHGQAPFVVTNSNGSLVLTQQRSDGTIWSGFGCCPPEKESRFLRRMHQDLWRISKANEWPNRCKTLAEAMALAEAFGMDAAGVTVPVGLLKEACGENLSLREAERLMMAQGHVAAIGTTLVFAADMTEGTALVTCPPLELGEYARSDDYLAVSLFRADRAVIVVGMPDGVA